MLSIKKIKWKQKLFDQNIAKFIMHKYNLSFQVSCLIASRLEYITTDTVENFLFETKPNQACNYISETSLLSEKNDIYNLSHINYKDIDNFLSPKLKNLLIDIYHLKDLVVGVDLIKQAILSKKNICIYGDYDVDGASATALLTLFFRDLKIKTNLYIPDRLNEGYGLNIAAIDKIKEQGNDIIIAVDNGSTSFDQIKHANDKEIQVIVIDHHITEEKMPDAIVINPNRLDQISPYKNLCATGVTWIFCVALRTAIEKYIYIPKAKLLEYLDIVSLATICDVMPLHGLNRFFVKYGISIMNNPNKGNVGIKNLLSDEKASVGVMGFKIGAMINAGSRLENSYLAVNLLIQDKEKSNIIANQLYNLNETRKEIEKNIYNEAYQEVLKSDKKNIIIISSDEWHIGVIGIIASRIMEEFNKPCIIISYQGEVGIGSCRSIKQINIGELIINAKNNKLVISGGGHSMAAGFKIDKSMHNKFIEYIDGKTPAVSIKEKKFDLEIDVKSINLLLLQKLSILEPYGTGNRNPMLLITNIECKQIKILKNLHIMCILANNIKAFAFRSINNNIGHFLISYLKCKSNKLFNIIGTLSQFNNSVSIIINDIVEI